MASRRPARADQKAKSPSKPKKTTPKKKAGARKPSLLGNDPFERGAAPRPGSLAAAPQRTRANTPELQRPPEAARGPVARPSSPSLGVDPRPHAGAPALGARAGDPAAPPSLGVDPRPHAGAPALGAAGDPVAHPSSPSLGVDPQPHAGAPSAGGPVAHAASPSLGFEPRAHASAPVAEALEAEPDAPDAGPASSTPRAILKALRAALGTASSTAHVDHWGKDASLATSLRPLAELLYERYWRVNVEGAEHVPAGPCLIVANHAGALPLDGPLLHLALRRERPELRESRWLLEDQIFHAPFVGTFANRLGAVRASPENALRLLAEDRPVIVFPEGFHGLSKPFSERYQLRRFGRGGSVKIACRGRVPLIPAAIVGGEESMPLLGKLPGGLLGLQYLPLTLPPLPAKWTIRFGPALPMHDAPREPERDLAFVERTNTALREAVEAMLAELLAARPGVFRGQ